MNRLKLKRIRLDRRKRRVKASIVAKTPRPRLVFNRSNRTLSAQIVDDVKGVTVCSASTNEKGGSLTGKNKAAAAELGKLLASRAIEKGVKQVALDRRGVLYHGKIVAFADAARETGLEF